MSASPVTLDEVRRALESYEPVRLPELGRPAAVLVPLFERAGRAHVLLTKRTETLRNHAGQISFPGGGQELGDAHLAATALRETHEELGLSAEAVTIVGALDDCPTFVSNFVITPWVGVVPADYPYVPSTAEIAALIEAPLDAFLAPGVLRTEEHERSGSRFTLSFYEVAGHTVWGATARILTRLFELVGRA